MSKKKETKEIKVKKTKPVSVEVTPKVTKTKLACHLEIKVNDVHFKTNAKDLETALAEFVESPDFPLGAKTTVVIKYSIGENKGTRILHTNEARRVLRLMSLKPSAVTIFANKLTQSLE